MLLASIYVWNRDWNPIPSNQLLQIPLTNWVASFVPTSLWEEFINLNLDRERIAQLASITIVCSN